jgi:hypothetical protein
MTCHSDSRNLRTCLLQISGQTGTAIAPLGSKISITDLFTQFHILTFTFTLRILKPTVVATSGHSQNPTHHLNRPSLGVVVPYKGIDQRPLLEMMLSAFFNISRSVSASYKRFSKSAMRLASSLTDWLPFFSNEFPVCHQMSYGIFPCNPFETIDQFDAFPSVGVAPLVHHRIDDRECHPIIYDAESENVYVRIAVLPVGPVHSKIVGTLNGY